MIINLSTIALTIAVSNGCGVPCRDPGTKCHITGCGCVEYFGNDYDSVDPSLRCEAPTTCGQFENCVSYFDGCNSCGCSADGFERCTLSYCAPDEYKDSYCTACADGYQLVHGQCEPATPLCGGFDNCAQYFDGCNRCICGVTEDACQKKFCPLDAFKESYCTQCTDGYEFAFDGVTCIETLPPITCASTLCVEGTTCYDTSLGPKCIAPGGVGPACGGIANLECKTGYECIATDTFPDAAGVCVNPTYEEPVTEPCGTSQCLPGQYCCNKSCGICAAEGEMCTQQLCEPPICGGFDHCAQYFNGCNTCQCTEAGEECTEKFCTALEETYCIQCEDGYYLAGTECVPCPQVRCADPCVDLETGEAKCAENERCRTKATFLDSTQQCPGCDEFRKCKPKKEREQCGLRSCPKGLVCCNALCGICAPEGVACVQGCAP